jgi:hypothetical protein
MFLALLLDRPTPPPLAPRDHFDPLAASAPRGGKCAYSY